MAGHRIMRIRTTPPNNRKIISAINLLKGTKATRGQDIPAELFFAVLAIFAELCKVIGNNRSNRIDRQDVKKKTPVLSATIEGAFAWVLLPRK